MELTQTDLSKVVINIWKIFFGLEIEETDLEDPSVNSKCLMTSCVQITGEWEGAVTVKMDSPMARRHTSIMYDVDPDSAPIDKVQDVLGEMANMIAGNIKNELPGFTSLSLPTVAEGSDYILTVPGSHVMSEVSFSFEGQSILVSLLQSSN